MALSLSRYRVRGRWRWVVRDERGRFVGGEARKEFLRGKFTPKKYRKPPVVEVPEVVEEVKKVFYSRQIEGYCDTGKGGKGEGSPARGGNYRVVVYWNVPFVKLTKRRIKSILKEELDYFSVELVDYHKGRAVAEALIENGAWCDENDEELDSMEAVHPFGEVWVELVIRDWVESWRSHAAM